MAQDLTAKNPRDFCKPPKRARTPINALPREERSRMLELARRAQPAPLGIAIGLALATGMRRGEACALRWSDLSDVGTITVSRALGNGDGGFYVKEPKTSSSLRTIPLTRRTFDMLRPVRTDAVRIANEFALPFGDPYILGTQEEKSRPYNPTQLGKDFSASCKNERLQVHLPRPQAHLRHHDDRGRLRREDRGELPGTRERVDGPGRLRGRGPRGQARRREQGRGELRPGLTKRSEERRVGKDCRSRWSP